MAQTDKTKEELIEEVKLLQKRVAGLIKDESGRKELDDKVIRHSVELARLNVDLREEITERKKAQEELRESEERYRMLFAGAAEGILMADAKTRQFRYANPAICRMFGYAEEEMLRLGLADIHPKESLGRVQADFEAQLRGEMISTELPCLRKDGTIFYASISAAGIVLGGPKFNVGFFTDITERRKAEAETKALKKQMEFVLGATKTGLDIIDSGFNMVYIDPEWQKAYGEYEGKKCYKYFMGSNTACPNCGVAKALKTKKPVVSEEILAKEGNRPIQVITIPFQDEKGNWLVAEVNVDITERKKAEERLLIFSEAIAGASDCFMLTDGRGNITYINESVCKTFGYAPEELLKMNISKLDVDPAFAKKIVQEVRAKGKWSGEVANIRKNGEEFTSSLSAFNIKDEKGNLKGTMGILRDITERKKAEESLKESEKKLREDKLLLEQKNLALKELVEHMERVKNKTKEDIAINAEEFIFPIVKKLKMKGAPPKYIKLLEDNLKQLVSSFGRQITQGSSRLSPREIEICGMIKGGLSSKDVSELLNISCQTTEKHRKNIRKKLGLSNKKSNLAAYLQKL